MLCFWMKVSLLLYPGLGLAQLYNVQLWRSYSCFVYISDICGLYADNAKIKAVKTVQKPKISNNETDRQTDNNNNIVYLSLFYPTRL